MTVTSLSECRHLKEPCTLNDLSLQELSESRREWMYSDLSWEDLLSSMDSSRAAKLLFFRRSQIRWCEKHSSKIRFFSLGHHRIISSVTFDIFFSARSINMISTCSKDIYSILLQSKFSNTFTILFSIWFYCFKVYTMSQDAVWFWQNSILQAFILSLIL